MPTRAQKFIVLMAGGAAPTYSISGTVYDADGSTPVPSATVALGALSAVSAANGTYTISNVPAGTSGSMTCTKTGYSWTAITVAAMSGNLTAQNYTNAWWAAGGCAASCVAAYKAKGAASQAASYVNLVNPGTLDITEGATAPTWSSALGWIYPGAGAGLLDSGITIAAATWTTLARVNATALGARAFSAMADVYTMTTDGGSTNHSYRNGGTGGATLSVAGVLTGAHVVGMANTVAYLDGASDGTLSLGAPAAGTLIIGNRSATDRQFKGSIQGLVVYNATLTPTQALAVTNAMNAF